MKYCNIYPAIIGLPLILAVTACAPSHPTDARLTQVLPAAHIDSQLPESLKNGWPQEAWWTAFHDPQLNALITRALRDAPDMAVAQQRIKLAEAQARSVQAQSGPQVDFSADVERQKMSAEGLMGPFAFDDPAAGTTGPWYTNGTFGLTAGWSLDLWGKDEAQVRARIGKVKADIAELAQTRQLLASSVARLYWQWQTESAVRQQLEQIQKEQTLIVRVDALLYQQGITNAIDGVENDINVGKTQQQLADIDGSRKEIEARLMALTNTQAASLPLHSAPLPTVAAQLPADLGYQLLARRPDLQEAHWLVESTLSDVDAAKAAFYPDINLMAFLQQDALHLSDLFRHSAQQMGVTGGLTLPIFDSGRLNASLDIASAGNNLSIANYNKAVVEAVNQVARSASQLETIVTKSQQQAKVQHDAGRVETLAKARLRVGIISQAQYSHAKLPALREQINTLKLQGEWLDASVQLTSALGGGYHAPKS